MGIAHPKEEMAQSDLIVVCKHLMGEIKRELDFSQLCPSTGQEAMGTK